MPSNNFYPGAEIYLEMFRTEPISLLNDNLEVDIFIPILQ